MCHYFHLYEAKKEKRTGKQSHRKNLIDHRLRGCSVADALAGWQTN